MAIEIETHKIHKNLLEEKKDQLTVKETMLNGIMEEFRFCTEENKCLNKYKEEADGIINNLSNKIIKLENELFEAKGDLAGGNLEKFMSNSSPNAGLGQNKNSILNNEMEMEVNFIKREASQN